MLNNLWTVLLDFKWFVIVGVGVGIFLSVVGNLIAYRVNWNGKAHSFLGIFYGRTQRESIWQAAGLLRIVFVVTVIIFGMKLELFHLLFFGTLTMFLNIVRPSFGRFVTDILNSTVVFVALYVCNIIYSYLRDYKQYSMIGVYVLLGLFVTLYTSFFYLRDTQLMIEESISN